ncbi:MAG: type II toxin-antitoxin system VapC family toxin [Thermomicrobiales bacterium]
MIVVDASVAIKWVLEEEHTEQARALYRACLRDDVTIIAPPLLPSEVANTLRQRMRSTPSMPRANALALLDRFLSLSIEIRAPENLHRQALILAADFDLPAVYDAQYLVLAQFYGCDLWTADQRFRQRLNGAFPFVRWIGDYVA